MLNQVLNRKDEPMSYPDDKKNPWTSLAELLGKKISVAALATAIEKEGIRTWDRFGRFVKASVGDASDSYSQAQALDLVAHVNKLFEEKQDTYEQQGELHRYLEDYDSPLFRFGWPADECPDFGKYVPAHPVPEEIRRAGQPQAEGLLGTRERNSLYAIIRVLLKEAKMPSEPYKTAEIISSATSYEHGTCEVSRNCVADHLKRALASSRES